MKWRITKINQWLNNIVVRTWSCWYQTSFNGVKTSCKQNQIFSIIEISITKKSLRVYHCYLINQYDEVICYKPIRLSIVQKHLHFKANLFFYFFTSLNSVPNRSEMHLIIVSIFLKISYIAGQTGPITEHFQVRIIFYSPNGE